MRTLNEIIQCPEFSGYRRPQVLAMYALRKFALHSDEPEILSYEKSRAAQWCLQSLMSSIRELRIAAGYVHGTIPCFLPC
jgi:serine/threonine-protein kinase ATR